MALKRLVTHAWGLFLPMSESPAGFTVAVAYAEAVADATTDRLIAITVAGDCYAFVGAAAPADDSDSVLIPAGTTWHRVLGAGDSVYMSAAAAGTEASSETWLVDALDAGVLTLAGP